MRDPYQTLGVSRSASADEIKSAYRNLAKKLHPDLNPGKKDIEQRFKEVTAAYDLLSDTSKRARFDRGEIDAMGNERGFGGGGGRSGGDPFANWRSRRSGSHDDDSFVNFGEDIFADLFGSGKRRGGFSGGERARMRGQDVTYALTVSFNEACLGSKQRVTLSSGKTVDVAVPAGAEDGTKLRLKGQGQPGQNGAEAGDAIIEISVAPHPIFTRKGRDIHLDAPVGLHEAVLGAQIKVPTLDGLVSVKVPANANTGTVLRLKGKGIAAAGSAPAGDLYVKLRVVLPEQENEDLTKIIEKWAKKNAYDPRAKLGWK